MTDRDHFAAAALTGLVGECGYHSPEDVAMESYALADAMLRERERVRGALPKEKLAEGFDWRSHIRPMDSDDREALRKCDEAWGVDHDPEPAGKAQSCEVNLPQAASELGNPVRQLTQDSTGNTHEPVAWAVVYPNGEEAIIAIRKSDAFDMASASDRVVPLYRSPTLTDEERAAIMWFSHYGLPEGRAATLRAFLERVT